MPKKKAVKKPVSQEEPLFDINRFHFEVHHSIGLTQKQKDILKIAQKPSTKMIILDGLPGTSKTFLSTLIALERLRDKKAKGVTAFRSSVVAADGDIGYLPGEQAIKMQHLAAPFYHKMEELLKSSDKEIICKHCFDVLPSAFVRSFSLKDECIIFGEAQNGRFDTIFDISCRAGDGSFVIIEGDTIMQNDLGKQSGFKKFCSLFNDEESKENGIYYFQFDKEDIVRSGLVQYLVTKRLEAKV